MWPSPTITFQVLNVDFQCWKVGFQIRVEVIYLNVFYPEFLFIKPVIIEQVYKNFLANEWK